ncbi:ABC transporter substrate-binding protein [uncultured Caballeronia sp.]|uniref:ABC transporter substrate-binding protein n=1 Tax=uncultured Caballeronia sp. TaxID=1827198 RepID=UPI0035C94E62
MFHRFACAAFYVAMTVTGVVTTAVAAGEPAPYALKAGRPYAGQSIKVMAVSTPQFTALQKRTQEFTDLTGIEVKWSFVPFKALQEKVTSVGVAANGNFDVVNYLDQWGASYAYWLMPLNDYIARDKLDLNDYPPAFLEALTINGKLNGLPLRSNVQMMLYRKDIFAKLGLKPPKTWQDLIDAGPKIRAAFPDVAPLGCYYGADGNRQNLFAWADFVRGAGGRILDDRGYPAWTSPKAMEATREYVGLMTKNNLCGAGATSNVEQDSRVAFQQGRSAVLPIWQWAYSAATNPKDSTLTKDQVGFAPMPAYKAGDPPSTVINVMPVSISAYSKHKDASWEFLKWVTNSDLDKRNAIERNVNGFAVVNSVVNRWSSMGDPQVNAANDHILLAAKAALEGNAAPMPEVVYWPEVADLASVAINQAASGGDVDALMNTAAQRANHVVQRALR